MNNWTILLTTAAGDTIANVTNWPVKPEIGDKVYLSDEQMQALKIDDGSGKVVCRCFHPDISTVELETDFEQNT